MYPSECGRALKYVTCKGKNGCSIIPKRDAEKRQLLQRPNPNILPTILPKAPQILCRRDYMYNRKRTSQITGHFPNKSQLQPTDNTHTHTHPHTHPHTHTYLPYLYFRGLVSPHIYSKVGSPLRSSLVPG